MFNRLNGCQKRRVARNILKFGHVSCLKDCMRREMQFTLVDCPGHASLIRTIIGGAQIIDLMLLVVDVTKGIQAGA